MGSDLVNLSNLLFFSTGMVILFLTDGRPSESASDILDELSALNAAKENKVLLLTYGLDYNGEFVNDSFVIRVSVQI